MSSEPAAKPATAPNAATNPEGEDVMTCCAAAICAVVRHSVSSPLPVLGCSALPRHCVMHAWALRAVTVHTRCLRMHRNISTGLLIATTIV